MKRYHRPNVTADLPKSRKLTQILCLTEVADVIAKVKDERIVIAHKILPDHSILLLNQI